MSIATQPAGRVDLASFAAAFSQDVANQLDAVQRAADEKIRLREAEEEKRARHRRVMEKRRARLTERRIRPAREGLARLVAFGKNPALQQILETRKRINRSYNSVVFYQVSRIAGDAWELGTRDGPASSRDVSVQLYADCVFMSWGSAVVACGDEFRLTYEPTTPDPEPYGAGIEDNPELRVESFLLEIAGPYPADLSIAERPEQRTYPWEPEDVLFQFLISCADELEFEKYVQACLAILSRELAEHFM